MPAHQTGTARGHVHFATASATACDTLLLARLLAPSTPRTRVVVIAPVDVNRHRFSLFSPLPLPFLSLPPSEILRLVGELEREEGEGEEE